MKLTKIEIKGLFDLFDYEIPLTNEENLLIITGPNGFGKTMILNIIDSLFNNKLEFFQKLVFKFIAIWVDEKEISIRKGSYESVELIVFDHNRQIHLGALNISGNYQIDKLDKKDLARLEKKDTQRIEFYKNVKKEFDVFNVHLIKEQRLLRRNPKRQKKTTSTSVEFYLSFENENFVIDTIEEYANELRDLINANLENSYTITQQIDSTFPKRLFNEKGTLSIEEFDERFKLLKEKQEKLKRFGLSESEQEIPDYDEKNASVLLVYLKDSEDKNKVFDGLLRKLELFTNILNERRFTFKSIKIDRKKGFIFLTQKGVELSLTDLSSGEQHEVVLLYELIFKTNPNTLVLIDEPEISLHVTWQKDFLSDLLKILELQKMQVIVATHSPQIINDRWDLIFNLEAPKMQ